MKIRESVLSSVLVLSLSLTGCLERQFAEDSLTISTDREEIVVPSDSEQGKDFVTDTVWVSANRSWTAEVENGVDWVECALEGHRNLSRVTDKIPLILRFKDNEGGERTAKILLCSQAGKHEVTVKQRGIDYRLDFGNIPEDFLDLSYEADTCTVIIKTNTEWSIAVKEGSSIDASFSQNSGKYTSEIKMYVKENPDMEVKSGAIVLSSPKFDKTVEMAVTQVKSKPYVKFPEGDEYSALDGVDDLVIPIKSNTDWAVTVESIVGYDKDKVKIEPSSGDKSATQIRVVFPASYDFSKKTASITIRLQAEGAAAVDAVICQTPCLRCCFGDPYTEAVHTRYDVMPLYDKTKPEDIERIHKYWPFSKYETEDGNGGWTEHGDGFDWAVGGTRDANKTVRCTLKNSGYILYIGVGKGVNLSPDYFSIGKDSFVYFGCPIVPGRALKKVEYWIRVAGLNVGVLDLNGNLVEGGDLNIASAKEPSNKAATLTGTEAGVEYRIGYQKTGYWFRFSDILFYYE